MSDDAPKLIVDDDWKSEAKKEKERLSQKAQETEAKQGPAGAPQELQFRDLVRTFASQAAMYLGLIPEPQSNQRLFAPDIARVNIDFLAILEQKTEGNLTDEEKKELSETVVELRTLFVETTAAVKQAMAEGKIPAQDAGTPGEGLRMPTE